MVMLSAQRKAKNPRGQCQSAPGENSFLTPALAIGYSLSTSAGPAPGPRAGYASKGTLHLPLLPPPAPISGASHNSQRPLASSPLGARTLPVPGTAAPKHCRRALAFILPQSIVMRCWRVLAL